MERSNYIVTRVVPWLVLLCLLAFVEQVHAVQRNLTQRYLLNAAGDITIASSINLHCSTATGATGVANCADARNGVGNRTNNQHTMVNVDVDASAATFNSSRAFLNLPVGATVAFAGLYWAGDSAATTPRNQVAWATPSSAVYTTLTASVVDDSAAAGTANQYQAFADVTAQVSAAGRGTYTVANISSTVNTTNVYAGWSLVVVYRLASEPTRNMVVYDGYRRVAGAASVDITLTGFTTPPFGTVTSKLGVVGYDGDKGSVEGTAGLQFGTSTATLSPVFNAVNPQTDVFNSTISNLGSNVTTRDPAYVNTLGYDADLFSPNTQLPNGATSAVVRVASSGETIDLGVVTLSTNIFVPNIKDSFLKSVTDVNGGVVVPGDVLEYTINFENTGNDPATRTVVVDPLPPNTTYLPGSIVLSSTSTGMPTGARTDVAGDDAAEFDSANNRVVVRVGRSATATVGGQFNPGDAQQLRFRVTVNAATPGGKLVDNFASVSYRALTVGTDITDVSDADAATSGDQPARVVVASPDLTVAKARFDGGQVPRAHFLLTSHHLAVHAHLFPGGQQRGTGPHFQHRHGGGYPAGRFHGAQPHGYWLDLQPGHSQLRAQRRTGCGCQLPHRHAGRDVGQRGHFHQHRHRGLCQLRIGQLGRQQHRYRCGCGPTQCQPEHRQIEHGDVPGQRTDRDLRHRLEQRRPCERRWCRADRPCRDRPELHGRDLLSDFGRRGVSRRARQPGGAAGRRRGHSGPAGQFQCGFPAHLPGHGHGIVTASCSAGCEKEVGKASL